MTPLRAYFLGAYLGDGTITTARHSSSGRHFKIASIDYELTAAIQMILREEFQSDVVIYPKYGKTPTDRARMWELCSTKNDVLQFIVEHCGLDKTWPFGERDWDTESHLHFLAGLVDTDGFVAHTKNKIVKGGRYEQTRIGFTSTSSWILQFMEMCNRMRVRTKKPWVSIRGREHGHLGGKVVYGINIRVRDFIRQGGFLIARRKSDRLKHFAEKYGYTYPQRLYAKHLFQKMMIKSEPCSDIGKRSEMGAPLEKARNIIGDQQD